MQKNEYEPNNAKFEIRPASSEEAGLFYALPPEQDEALGAIGHVRIDFGRSGSEFWHTWHPRGPAELNSPERWEKRGVGKECRSRWSPYH